MNTYTVLSRLNDGTIEARAVSAISDEHADWNRRQFCALPEHHVAEVISVAEGGPRPFVACIVVAGGWPEYHRVTVEAADERQARVHAIHLSLITPEYVEVHWVEAAVPVHVHVSTISVCCDGRNEYHTTAELPELVERGSERSPRERLGAYVGAEVRSLLMFGIEFSVAQHGTDVIVIDRPSDEGGSSTAYTLCEDRLCDEFGKSSQRDAFAEAMGY